MRHFIIVLRNIDEYRKNIYILIRCISAALMISHGLRRDSFITIHLLEEERSITFNPKTLRKVRPDEMSLYGIFKKSFVLLEKKRKNRKNIHYGVTYQASSLESTLLRYKGYFFLISNKGQLLWKILGKIDSTTNITFIIPLAETKAILSRIKSIVNTLKIARATIIPKKIDKQIVVINNELDRKIYWEKHD